MNYWHTQLHPDDKDTFNETRIRELLDQRAVIGLGQWDDGEAVRNQFYDEMQVGDIVVVKNGNTPIALVRVVSEAYLENNVNKELDWFPNRRNIEVLDYYQNAYNFTFPDSRGTLKICRDLNAPTSKLIIDWYRTAQRNLLMENIKLSDKRKEEIKSLWKQFKNEYTESDCNEIQKAIDELQTQWAIYHEKIMDSSLGIDDYTNRKYSIDANMPGGYLCNFLERTTRVIYGSSKPGNANNFMVKLNEDGTTYTIKKELGRSEKQTNHSKDQAIEIFDESIKPLLHAIVTVSYTHLTLPTTPYV